MLEFLARLAARHDALKRRIHAARFPVPPKYLPLVGVVYFSLPVIAGYHLMHWTNASSELAKVKLIEAREARRLSGSPPR